jgi:hypothetical protein
MQCAASRFSQRLIQIKAEAPGRINLVRLASGRLGQAISIIPGRWNRMLQQMQAIKRLTTGLCVLALLLLAGFSSSTLIVPAQLQAHASSSAVALSSAGQGDGIPCSGHEHDHGLTCCGSLTCLTGLATLAAPPTLFDRQPRAIFVLVPQLSPSNADRASSFHPPRLSV